MSLFVSKKHPVNLYSGKGQNISLILTRAVVSGLAMELMREGTSMAVANRCLTNKPGTHMLNVLENKDARIVVQWRYALVDNWYGFAFYDSATG